MTNRRQILQLLAALCWWRPVPKAPEPRDIYPPPGPLVIRDPWADDTERRLQADPTNYYADYEAFEAWLSDWCERHPGQCAEGMVVLDLLERIDLYYLLSSVRAESRIVARDSQERGGARG